MFIGCLKFDANEYFMIAVGVDLAGKNTNPSGFCTVFFKESEINSMKDVIDNIEKVIIEDVLSNDDLVNRIKEINPNMTAIDAPFSIAKDVWRSSETFLLTKGFKPVSTQLLNMRALAERAIAINNQLVGYRKIETFSKSIETLLEINKDYLLDQIRDRLEKNGNWDRGKITKDQYDAILCALCAILHMQNKTELVGNKLDSTDLIALPSLQRFQKN